MPDVFISENQEKKKAESFPRDRFFKLPGPNESVEGLPYHNHNPLSSFCYLPHRVDFVNKEPDERVILLVRRHFITNFGWLSITIIMALAPNVLKFFPLLSFMPQNFQLVCLLIWYLLTSAIFLQGFLSWFFSVNIVTDQRIIDVDFVNLIYREVTDVKIGHIEDVTVAMGSVIKTLFDFGDLNIQTAAEIPEAEFENVPHPDKIDKILSDLRLKERQL